VDDAALVAQAIEGSERAFAALYKRHARYVAGVVHRILGRDDELDDILQEAFIDASHALEGLREPGDFRAWLVRITIRRVHKRLGKRRLMRRLAAAMEWIAPRVETPAAEGEVRALYHALDKLSPKVRIPWVLHVIEGETLPDVAKSCDVSLATVKRRIAEAESTLGGVSHGS
jgi:RNA polymerase sigma-70 factor (ECF subfamily)